MKKTKAKPAPKFAIVTLRSPMPLEVFDTKEEAQNWIVTNGVGGEGILKFEPRDVEDGSGNEVTSDCDHAAYDSEAGFCQRCGHEFVFAEQRGRRLGAASKKASVIAMLQQWTDDRLGEPVVLGVYKMVIDALERDEDEAGAK